MDNHGFLKRASRPSCTLDSPGLRGAPAWLRCYDAERYRSAGLLQCSIYTSTADTSQSLRTRKPLAMLLGMYDRRISSVEDVSSHFESIMITRATDGTTPLFTKLFEIYLRRYMHGVGHPHELLGTDDELTEEDFVASAHDPFLRAHLVLEAAGDYDMLPMEDDWSIKVGFVVRTAFPFFLTLQLQFNFAGCFRSVSCFHIYISLTDAHISLAVIN